MSFAVDACFLLLFSVVLPAFLVMLTVVATWILPLQPVAVVCATVACAMTAHQFARLRNVSGAGALWAVFILLLIPVLALLCWMTMMLEDFSQYFDMFKALYESFTFFCFLMLLNDRRNIGASGGAEFWSVFQYVIVNAIFACIAFATPPSAIVDKALYIIAFISCSIALVAVASLHHAVAQTISNECKFWSIKGLFSVLFNQHLLLVFLPSGLLPESLSVAELERALICLELLPLAVAHRWAYPVEEFGSDEEGLITAEPTYGAAELAVPQHQSKGLKVVNMDDAFGVGFLTVFCSLLLATYTWQVGTAQTEKVAYMQQDQCHWYYWLWYWDRCSPQYYHMEAWLKHSAVVNAYVRLCILLFFVTLLVPALGYTLLKLNYMQLRPSIAKGLFGAARYVLSASLVLSALAMSLVAGAAALRRFQS